MRAGWGPKDRWETELGRVSKPGLANLCALLFEVFTGYSREEKLEMVRGARRNGRILSLIDRMDRFDANPEAFMRASIARQRSAAKAARKRKRERRKNAA